MGKQIEYALECIMCEFLVEGYGKAHSKQAKAEYGEGYLRHRIKFHQADKGSANEVSAPTLDAK